MSSNAPFEKFRTAPASRTMTLGDLRITAVSGGTYRLDGGTLFGVVPRKLWSKHFEPDERNTILQETNCMLVETGSERILIDTGYGSKLPEKFRFHHAIEDGDALVKNLSTLGISPEQVDRVILSHLHFDHAGGGTRLAEDGSVVATFPNAEYVVNRIEWVAANSDAEELKGSYFRADFEGLENSGQLRLVSDGDEIVPGIRVWQTGGHTLGHQSIILESGDEGAVYAGDICATAAHCPMAWCMAYDMYQLETRQNKLKLMELIEERGWWLLFDHDPYQWGAMAER